MKKKQSPARNRSRAAKSNALMAVLLVLLLFVVSGLVYVFWPEAEPTTQSQKAQPSPAGSSTKASFATSSQTTTKLPTAPTTSTSAPTALDKASRQAALARAGDQVTALLDKAAQGRYAVYFHNLVGGETWAYQAEEPFVAASSIKLGITSCLYEQIAAGQIKKDEILSYDNRPYPTGDYEPGTGTIQGLPNGAEFSVSETAALTIKISDNCATNMIIRRLGGIDAINPWLKNISGIVDYRDKVSYLNYGGQSQSGRHRTCAKDLGLHAVYLYEKSQDQPADYAELIDFLSETEFDFGIQKGIPPDIRVAHKIGSNGAYSAENDVGIVYTTEPFVLCVMTETASAASARQIQADVAAIFYQAVAGWPGE